MANNRCLQNREERRRRALWVSEHIMPHERKIRSWLSRWGVPQDERDELIQESYCALWSLDEVDHIKQPAAYFFSIVRNYLKRAARSAKVVPIELMSDHDIFQELQPPSPETLAADRLDCAKLMQIIERLPPRCQQTVRLRKVEGWSQKQIAAYLGVSEKTVEAQIWVGVRAIRAEWSRQESEYGVDQDVELLRVKRFI